MVKRRSVAEDGPHRGPAPGRSPRRRARRAPPRGASRSRGRARCRPPRATAPGPRDRSARRSAADARRRSRMPVSRTPSAIAASPRAREKIVTLPPAGVWRTALSTRLREHLAQRGRVGGDDRGAGGRSPWRAPRRRSPAVAASCGHDLRRDGAQIDALRLRHPAAATRCARGRAGRPRCAACGCVLLRIASTKLAALVRRADRRSRASRRSRR